MTHCVVLVGVLNDEEDLLFKLFYNNMVFDRMITPVYKKANSLLNTLATP